MDDISNYTYAIVSVVIYAVIAQILNAATGIRKGGADIAPGGTHQQKYDNFDYRLDRTYMNTIEMGVFFFALVGAAVLAEANPFWTNLLASLGLAFRILANMVYLRGIGKPYGGLRTQILILASICNLGLALLVFMTLL